MAKRKPDERLVLYKKEIKERIKEEVEKLFEELPELLAQLEPKDKIEVMLKFLPYIQPKLTAIDLQATTQTADLSTAQQIRKLNESAKGFNAQAMKRKKLLEAQIIDFEEITPNKKT